MYNVLIVDDEAIAVEALLTCTDWKKYHIENVYVAYSAAQARKRLAEKKVDIILCDIEMPQESGLSLVQSLENTRKPEIVFITCHADFDYAKEAVHLQSFDYILKPVTPEKLEQLLNAVVQKLDRKKEEGYLLNYGELFLSSQLNTIKNTSSADRNIAEIVRRTSAYIKNHLNEDLNVETLAGKEFVNPDYLSKSFKKITGYSLNRYIIQERMYLACKLLEETDITINEIADSVGYKNYSHFTQTFRQIYSITPSEYRTAHNEI